MQLKVVDENGQAAGTVDFDESLLGEKIRKRLMHHYVVMWENNQRLGTRSTKTKGSRKGTGKKQWQQKHTGRARCHYRRAPHWRKGGVAHGPQTLDFSYQMNRKAKREALKSSLLTKFKDNEVIVIDRLQYDEPKTSRIAKTFKSTGAERSVLLITPDVPKNLIKSVRNLPRTIWQQVCDMNCYSVLRANRVIITKDGLVALQEFLSSKASRAKAANAAASA